MAGGACAPCLAGGFCDGLAIHACAENSGTNLEGSKTEADCECSPGYSRVADACTLCPPGLFKAEFGVDAVVATSDDPESTGRIAEFRDSSDPWLVAVRMVSEGVDLPRLRVGDYVECADAANASTCRAFWTSS